MQVNLPSGNVLTVSPEDYHLLEENKYFQRNGIIVVKYKNRDVRLHRLVMNCLYSKNKVLHINGNKFDNRRENLFAYKFSEQPKEKFHVKNPHIPLLTDNYLYDCVYKGVYKTSDGEFYTQLNVGEDTVRSRNFKKLEDCAKCRDDMIIVNEVREKLNFPDLYPEWDDYVESLNDVFFSDFFPVKHIPKRTFAQLLISGEKRMYALVSPEDYNKVVPYTWYFAGGNVLESQDFPLGRIKLHRLLAQAEESDSVSHVNGVGIDNRRENLCIKKEGECNYMDMKNNFAVHREPRKLFYKNFRFIPTFYNGVFMIDMSNSSYSKCSRKMMDNKYCTLFGNMCIFFSNSKEECAKEYEKFFNTFPNKYLLKLWE